MTLLTNTRMQEECKYYKSVKKKYIALINQEYRLGNGQSSPINAYFQHIFLYQLHKPTNFDLFLLSNLNSRFQKILAC